MKASLLLLTITCTTICRAQDTLAVNQHPRKIIYRIELTSANTRPITGYLSGLDDSAVYVSPTRSQFGMTGATTIIPYSNLDLVRIRRKSSVGRGILIGSISGLLAGAIVGVVSSESRPSSENSWFTFDFTPAELGAAGAAVGAVGGGIIGAIIGAVATKKFIIKGRKEKHQAMKMNIWDKVYSSHK